MGSRGIHTPLFITVIMFKSDTEKVLLIIFHLKIDTQAYLEPEPFCVMERGKDFSTDLNFNRCYKTAHL